MGEPLNEEHIKFIFDTLIAYNRLFKCHLCGFVSNSEKQHYEAGCCNCMPKGESND